jgi:CRISPR system Cascade subunit CasD
VLGLVGAALRLRRNDSDGLAALDASIGLASRTDAPGHLLIDFHTAQGPKETLLASQERAARKSGASWHRPGSRRAELTFRRGELSTLLSQREYRVDALWTVALWRRDGMAAGWALVDLAAALVRPGFVPYLGRKSCAVDLPLEPQIVEAGDPVAAMGSAVFRSDPLLGDVIAAGQGRGSVRWEDTWPGLSPDQTSRRRDRVLSRARWQFTERLEHERAWRPSDGGHDVPQQG